MNIRTKFNESGRNSLKLNFMFIMDFLSEDNQDENIKEMHNAKIKIKILTETLLEITLEEDTRYKEREFQRDRSNQLYSPTLFSI